MAGFLSALFAAPDDNDETATSSDHQAIDQGTAVDPSVHAHLAEDGTEHRPDGSATGWSGDQNVDAHIDMTALTHLGLDESHASNSN